jgi:signal peptidase II
MHALFLIFIIADQITKTVFSERDFFLLGLDLHPARNYGLPFGWNFGGGLNFFILLLIYVVVGWLIIRMPVQNRWQVTGKALFLAGAASNLADRLIYGYVRDFIDIRLGFIFNLADLFIVIGLFLLIVSSAKKQKVDKPTATGNS